MYIHDNYVHSNIVRYPLRKSSRASLVVLSSKTTSSSAIDTDGSSFWISFKRVVYIFTVCVCRCLQIYLLVSAPFDLNSAKSPRNASSNTACLSRCMRRKLCSCCLILS